MRPYFFVIFIILASCASFAQSTRLTTDTLSYFINKQYANSDQVLSGHISSSKKVEIDSEFYQKINISVLNNHSNSINLVPNKKFIFIYKKLSKMEHFFINNKNESFKQKYYFFLKNRDSKLFVLNDDLGILRYSSYRKRNKYELTYHNIKYEFFMKDIGIDLEQMHQRFAYVNNQKNMKNISSHKNSGRFPASMNDSIDKQNQVDNNIPFSILSLIFLFLTFFYIKFVRY